MKKKALIFGITGQDGSYLTEFLLKKNYIIHGVVRRSSSINTKRIDHLYEDLHISNSNLILHFGSQKILCLQNKNHWFSKYFLSSQYLFLKVP